MAYDSIWERLNDITRRVVDATGCSKEEAQADICQAVADGAVRIRGGLKEHTTKHMTSKSVLEGTAFERPPTIKPQDVDWEQSCPLKPWVVKRGAHALPGSWLLAWIEVSRIDIAAELCGEAGQSVDVRNPIPTQTALKHRSQPGRERAERAIQELYPEGLPDQPTLPNAKLCREVGEKLKQRGLPHASDDTILRAARRRK